MKQGDKQLLEQKKKELLDLMEQVQTVDLSNEVVALPLLSRILSVAAWLAGFINRPGDT